MVSYNVYIIKSKVKKWFYVGFTKDINQRLNAHNLGFVRSTKSFKPYDLIYVQVVDNRIEARKLEKYLKIKFNKESLLNIMK